MKQQVWQSQYFKQVFKTMCLVTFPVLLLALVVLYASFYRSNLSYLNAVTQRFLTSTANNIKYQVECSKKNTLNAYTSSAGVTLMSTNGASTVDTLQAMRDVDYFLSQDPMIDSVYFYNGHTREIYMFGSNLRHSPVDTFFDTDATAMILDNTPTQPQMFPRVIPGEYNFMEPQPTLSAYYRMSNGDAVIINLDVNELFEILKSDATVYSNAPTSYQVYYDRQQPMYSSLYHDTLTDIDQEQLLEILRRHDWAESFSADVRGVRFHFNVLLDPESNTQTVSMIRESDISNEFLPYHILFIVVAFLGCFVSIVVTLRCSTRLYSPINRLRKMFPSDEKNIGRDEIEYIAENIANTTSRLEHLFEYKEKSLPLSQSALIKKQLLYNQYSDEEFWAQCAQQELPYRKGDKFVLLFAKWMAPQEAEPFPTDEQRLLCYALSNVFHELSDGQINSQDLPFEASGIAFLCSFEPDANATLNENILTSIQATFRQYFHVSLSFFISREFSRPSQMHPIMCNLQEVSDYQYFHAQGCILHEKDFNFEALCSDLCPLPDMTALENLLRAADFAGCQELLDHYFASMPQYTRESASTSVNMLASKLITLMKKLQSSQPAFPDMDYHEFFRSVTLAASLHQARALILDTLKSITDTIADAHNDTEKLLADEVLRHLEQNYQDYNLSSKSIALYHHVSVAYLNRIFKQKTGEAVASYVKNLRLEHARALLLSTNLSVESIARKVGFENTKYFYTLFKGKYGVSPSSYRINKSLLDAPGEAETIS